MLSITSSLSFIQSLASGPSILFRAPVLNVSPQQSSYSETAQDLHRISSQFVARSVSKCVHLKKYIDCLIEGEGGASIAKLINVVKAMPSLCSKRPSRRNHVILSKQALISLSIMV